GMRTHAATLSIKLGLNRSSSSSCCRSMPLVYPWNRCLQPESRKRGKPEGRKNGSRVSLCRSRLAKPARQNAERSAHSRRVLNRGGRGTTPPCLPPLRDSVTIPSCSPAPDPLYSPI